MRSWKWLAAAALLLAGAAPSFAQTSVFGGISPSSIVNQPIDTSASVVPIAQPMTVSNTLSSLTSFFGNISPFNPNPVIGMSTYPSYSQLPGKNYLRAFGYRRLPVIKPD